MNKVLVDRELLERTAAHLEWDGSEPMTTIQFSQKCDVLADELRRSIAQPAEAEGVELTGEYHADCNRLIAALSAVTAERDRLREDRDSQQRVCIAEMEKANQLRAEVERLRPVAREFAGFFSSDNPRHWDLHALADGAAMAAKEA